MKEPPIVCLFDLRFYCHFWLERISINSSELLPTEVAASQRLASQISGSIMVFNGMLNKFLGISWAKSQHKIIQSVICVWFKISSPWVGTLKMTNCNGECGNHISTHLSKNSPMLLPPTQVMAIGECPAEPWLKAGIPSTPQFVK